ncbi:hypothetical protein AGMMS49982_17680 [Bacteroidia bacterium]|nr:hypothetical protein AGMMS49982_17680 [Bacteroidia bacterium]
MVTTAVKAATAEYSQSAQATVKKSKFTEFWEKYPNGTLTVLDWRAVEK